MEHGVEEGEAVTLSSTITLLCLLGPPIVRLRFFPGPSAGCLVAPALAGLLGRDIVEKGEGELCGIAIMGQSRSSPLLLLHAPTIAKLGAEVPQVGVSYGRNDRRAASRGAKA